MTFSGQKHILKWKQNNYGDATNVAQIPECVLSLEDKQETDMG